MRLARRAEATNASTSPRISSRDSSRGTGQPSPKAMAEGPTVCHGDSAGPSALPPCQGTCEEALRPAWPICTPIGFFVMPRYSCTARAIAASLWSLYRPVQPCVMRPSRATLVFSTTNRPAPEQAMLPRCARCQSLMQPSSAEYWHMGAMTTRLGRVTPPIWIGSNSLGCGNGDSFLGEGLPQGLREGHGPRLVAVQTQRI